MATAIEAAPSKRGFYFGHLKSKLISTIKVYYFFKFHL